MTERDEDGRPVATPNAGAFLAPIHGVVPVPSSIIDQRGASVEHPIEAEVERRGPRDTMPRPDGRTAATPRDWLLASGTAISVWSICYAGLDLVLGATAWVGDSRPVTPGRELLALLHDDVMHIAVSVLLLGLATRMGAMWLPARGARAWTLLIVSTILGALVMSSAIVELGPVAAVLVMACAAVFLALAYQSRPL